MIELIVAVAIVVVGAVCMQWNHYAFLERQQNFITPESIQKEMEATLQLIHEQAKLTECYAEELAKLKERVDALTLRAGFKS